MRTYQTALRCKGCKVAVVNGQRKGSEKNQVSLQEMNRIESLRK